MIINSELNSLIFAAELNQEQIPSLDLHGVTYDQAIHEIDDFLSREHVREKRRVCTVVRIIAGSGSGRIQQALDDVLNKKCPGFVLHYAHQTHPLPSKAVTYVVLAPNSK